MSHNSNLGQRADTPFASEILHTKRYDSESGGWIVEYLLPKDYARRTGVSRHHRYVFKRNVVRRLVVIGKADSNANPS
jgi:hypothetical protein